jgi:hypothetical protein
MTGQGGGASTPAEPGGAASATPSMAAPILLLSATVNPGQCAFTVRLDPAVRWHDYQTALAAWCDILDQHQTLARAQAQAPCSVSKVVFCESSRWPLEGLAPLQRRFGERGIELELLSFHGQDYDLNLGKGFGEMGIIGHALAHSRLLAEGAPVMKVTGRYVVRNAGRLVADWHRLSKEHPGQPVLEVQCMMRDWLRNADSRIFICQQDFLRRRLLPQRAACNDHAGVFFEHVLARAAHGAMADGNRWRPMPVLPDISGIGASDGKSHHRSWSKVLRHQITLRMLRH